MPLPPRKRLRSLWTEGAAFFTSPFPFLRPPPAGVAAGAGAAAVVDALDDLQALAEALEVDHLPLPEEVEGLQYLLVTRHAHQVLVGGPGLLLGPHVLGDVRDGVSGAGDVGGGEGHAVGVHGEHAVVVHGVVPGEARLVQLRAGGALHALADHGADHLVVGQLLRAYIGQGGFDPIVGHGVALGEVTERRPQLRLHKQREYF